MEKTIHYQLRNNASRLNAELCRDFLVDNSICNNYWYRIKMHFIVFSLSVLTRLIKEISQCIQKPISLALLLSGDNDVFYAEHGLI